MNKQGVFIMCFVILSCSFTSVNAVTSGPSKHYKKVPITAEFISHMLIYFPLLKPREITLRAINGELKGCDITGMVTDDIDYKSYLAKHSHIDTRPSPREVSYSFNVTSKNCFGVVSAINGHGDINFKAAPGKYGAARYQTIKRKHKVVVIFDYVSFVGS